MKGSLRILTLLILTIVSCLPAGAQGKKKVIIDQDASGPGGSDMQ